MLGAGQFITTTNFITIPTIGSGSYYLILHVDAFGTQPVGQIWETNETNNYAVVPLHIFEPELVPTNIIAPALVSSREPLQLGWNIVNEGDGVATNLNGSLYFQWADALYLSTNQQVNPSSIMLGDYYFYNFSGESYYEGNYFDWRTPLLPGQAMTNLQEVIIPNVPAGDYFLVLDVDALNSIDEVSRANNVLAKPISLGTLDLAVTALSAPPVANSRSTIALAWTVANLGTGVVYPQWVDRVFVSSNATYDATATLLGQFVQTNQLASGTNYTVTNS
ncbi:MAG: hypothetical protein ACLPXB_07085, partial [Thiobacillaceae bacterium]